MAGCRVMEPVFEGGGDDCKARRLKTGNPIGERMIEGENETQYEKDRHDQRWRDSLQKDAYGFDAERLHKL